MVGLGFEAYPIPSPIPVTTNTEPSTTYSSGTTRRDRTSRGFKESTSGVSVSVLRAEIEEEFNLPQGSVEILRPSGEVAFGGMHLGTLAEELWPPSDWDYSDYDDSTLSDFAWEIASRFGLTAGCIAFRAPNKGKRYPRNSKVKRLRKEYGK